MSAASVSEVKPRARVVRHQSELGRFTRAIRRLGDIAHECGYCDQAHLNRDFRELAGTTPTDFVSRLIPGGGVIGDQLPFLQDSAAQAA